MTDEIRHLYDRIKEQLLLIKKLEERILAIERKESVVHIVPTDNWYWEYG